MEPNIIKVARYFIKQINKNTCSFCKKAGYMQDAAYCSDSCADKAFIEDAEAYLAGDLNDAKCEGTKSSPVGSPRQRSFCARMCGHKKKNTGKDTKSDPDSCVNQALRRWKCRCG